MQDTTTNPIRRGDIFYVNNPTDHTTHEQSGTRPAVVVSNNRANTHSPVLEVVYLTTSQTKSPLPTHVHMFDTCRHSIALCEQVHSIDRRKLGSYLCRASTDTMHRIDRALLISLGLSSRDGESLTA